jgi:PAS domain S-box-containing protein
MDKANMLLEQLVPTGELHALLSRLCTALGMDGVLLSPHGQVMMVLPCGSPQPGHAPPQWPDRFTVNIMASLNEQPEHATPSLVLNTASGEHVAAAPVRVAGELLAAVVIGPFVLRPNNVDQTTPNHGRTRPQPVAAVVFQEDLPAFTAHLELTAAFIAEKADRVLERQGGFQQPSEGAKCLAPPSQEDWAMAWRALFLHAPFGVVINRLLDGVYVDVNPAYEAISGRSRAEVLGKTHWDFLLPAAREQTVAAHRQLLETGSINSREVSISGKDGQIRHILYSAATFPSDGELYVISTFVDITEHKRTGDLLKEREVMLQSLFQAAPVGLAISRNRQLIAVNQQVCAITGYAVEELLNRTARQLYLTQEEYDRVGNLLVHQMTASPSNISVETHCLRRDGTVRDVELFAAPLDPHNPTAGAAVAIQDITERKRIEATLKQNQDMLHSLFRAVPVGLTIMKNRIFSTVNERLCAITGRDVSALVGHSSRQLYASEEEFQRIGEALLGKLWHQGRSYVETRFVRPDGSIRDVSLFGAPIDPSDPAAGVAVAIQDITDDKKILLDLKHSEDRFRTIADFTGQLIYDYDVSSGNIEWAGRVQDITGYTLEEINSQGFDGWLERIHPDDRERIQHLFTTAQRERSAVNTEYRWRRADGSYFFAEEEGTYFFNAQNQAIRMLGIIRDISARKRAEEALWRSEERLALAVNASDAAIWEIYPQTNCTYYSPRWYEMLGYADQELPMTVAIWEQLCHPQDRQATLETLRIPLERGSDAGFIVEFRMRHRDGSWIWVQSRGKVMQRDENDAPLLLAGTNTDISERKAAEKALRESEFRFRSFYHSNPESILLLDFQGTILDVNKAFVQESGYTIAESINRNFKEFVPEQDHARIIRAIVSLKSGVSQSDPIEFSYITKNGQLLPVAAKGWLVVDEASNPLYLGVFIRNLSKEKALVSEKTALEKQVIQAQKSEAIGTLAGGIAHDFNNILAGIIGYTELALLKAPPTMDTGIRQYLHHVLEAGNRAKDLVQQILRFSRHSTMAMAPMQLAPLIKETIRLLRSTLPTTIAIEYTIAVENDRILGDPTQMHQVVMNLCTNAYHAMRDSGGLISLTLEQVFLTAPRQNLDMHIAPGEFLQLRITDTGIGIPPAVLDRIFEPYFTTKKVNEGTGLGLAVTLGIIRGHHGLIEVESTPGQGTGFTIYLPITTAESGTPSADSNGLPLGHGERILIVDDEAFFLEVIHESLNLLGYQVTQCTSSLQALDTFRSNPDGFDLLITDQTMPEMTGTQLIQEIRAGGATVPVMLCTGYSETITEHNIGYYGISKLLMKPVNIDDLAKGVDAVLRAARSTDTEKGG